MTSVKICEKITLFVKVTNVHGKIVSLDMFRDLVKPRIDHIKTKTSAKIAYHTYGSTCWLHWDLIDLGFDILNSMQANVIGNEDLEKLMLEFRKYPIDNDRIDGEMKKLFTSISIKQGFLISTIKKS